MISTPGTDVVKTAEMKIKSLQLIKINEKKTIKDLKHYINLDAKIAAGFERTDSNFERSSTVGKILSNSTAHYMQYWWKEESVCVTYFFTAVLILINCRSHPNLQNYTLIT